MASIEIRKSHGLGMEDVRGRIASIEPDLRSRYSVVLTWRGQRAKVKGPGVQGEAWVDASSIGMRLDLGLLLRPLSRKIRSAIEDAIDEALQGAGPSGVA